MENTPTAMTSDLDAGGPSRRRNPDKLNNVDFSWFVLRSLPHQERKLAAIFAQCQAAVPNILEVYCPTHTTVSVSRNGREEPRPLFAGYVFVLATRQAVADVMGRLYPEGAMLYDRGKGRGGRPRLLTVPEEQMRAFKDFNENYAEHVVVLERPFSDYAFNPKTNEPNEIVKVVDGPLAGREGYLVRFRRDKRMVFRMKSPGSNAEYAISIPDVWKFHAVRLHNAEGDRQTAGTAKARAADLLAGILQGCGYGARAAETLHRVVETLAARPSLVELCKGLYGQGHEELGRRIAQLGTADAGLLLDLARYERDVPGYVRAAWPQLSLRPFLTPTAGAAMGEGTDEAEVRHDGFTETIRRVGVTERAYYPSAGREAEETAEYYAHVGVAPGSGGAGGAVFANWDAFLGEYFMTAGKANEKLVGGTRAGADRAKLIESFRNFAPTLYEVLTDGASPVKAVPGFKAGNATLNVLAVTPAADTGRAKDLLIATCTSICKEINSTTHLAVWRRYLRTVWLHK